jgi:EAL domain-containing protein (putative c-di-GMP-specific phosphodiesterase class I)
VQALGCDGAQGFYFGRPAAAAAAEQALDAGNSGRKTRTRVA